MNVQDDGVLEVLGFAGHTDLSCALLKCKHGARLRQVHGIRVKSSGRLYIQVKQVKQTSGTNLNEAKQSNKEKRGRPTRQRADLLLSCLSFLD